MTKQDKGYFVGVIEKDADGNYFCGEYLLDYRLTEANFKIGDQVEVRTLINNPSFKSSKKYPKKSLSFFLVKEEK